MNVTDMEVLHAQVAQMDTSSAQLLQVEATIDLSAEATTIYWYNVSEEGIRSDDSFASATVHFEDPAAWQTEWERLTHLVNGRVDALSQMAADGIANKLSKNLTYTLFKNVVDYTDKYRGMQSVVLNEYEAYADITLVPERHGTWHTPPHWIDSVCHLAGLIMNGSDASNTKDFFYVTPGWGSFRLVRPLTPGARYRSYVRMSPTKEANMYAGDVYIFQDDAVVGMMGEMKFRRVPRLLMDQFFSPTDRKKKNSESAPKRVASTPAAALPASSSSSSSSSKEPSAPKSGAAVPPQKLHTVAAAAPAVPATSPPAASEPTKSSAGASAAATPAPATSTATATEENHIIADCLRLIARETGLDADELTDDSSFVELGVDSLMSLVLSEKFRTELQLEVKSSLFIECPSLRDLKAWLEEYC